jgi:hypothetical protein
MKPTLVEDFGKSNKKVQLVSAGAHHSVIMTQQGDVYVCGSNTDGQLGMGDTEMRSGFTFLKSLGDKNVYRIFTGGNHTWVLLDEFIPIRKNARPPSPLDGERFKLLNKPRPRKVSKDKGADRFKAQEQLEKSKEFARKEVAEIMMSAVLDRHAQTMRESEFFY